MSAVGRELARDVSHLLFGREYLDVDDRLENGGSRLGERIEECLAARRHESDVLRIHRVRLAVVDDDAHVLQRESGDEARLENVAYTLLDRRDELLGDSAALHRVDELETLATRERLHPQVDFAELSGATGCLL